MWFERTQKFEIADGFWEIGRFVQFRKVPEQPNAKMMKVGTCDEI